LHGKPLVVVDKRGLCYTQDGNLTDPNPNSMVWYGILEFNVHNPNP